MGTSYTLSFNQPITTHSPPPGKISPPHPPKIILSLTFLHTYVQNVAFSFEKDLNGQNPFRFPPHKKIPQQNFPSTHPLMLFEKHCPI